MEITVPRLGWSMEEATFAAWLKPEGATVRAGEPLFTLESEKATQDVEALDSGILRWTAQTPQSGTTVKVGQCIGTLDSGGETAEKPVSLTASEVPTALPGAPALTPVSLDSGSATSENPVIRPGARASISPRALRLATEKGIDWRSIKGTGRTGRIREADVRVASKEQPPKNLTPIRRMIAARMLTSLRATAPVTLHSVADATAWIAMRNKLKTTALAEAVPSFTDLLICDVAAVLVQQPQLNARWLGEELSQLSQLSEIHIGLAVDTKAGLLVPVIRHANTLTLPQLSTYTRDLVARARGGTLAPHELTGGTFTVTSLGAFGIDAFTPIINYPECAILGLGQIRREPTVIGDQIVPRDRVTLSLTFDHRAFDGATAARFLQALCERMGAHPTT